MKTTLWAGIFWLLTLVMASAQTNDLTALLQQGLLEEQANQNLDAAITDYQVLATQFDKDRKVAATAVFRIGECYRMQGRTNEAAAQYERVLHDFSDQKVLAQLSAENLKGMGVVFQELPVSIILSQSQPVESSEMHVRQIELKRDIEALENQMANIENAGPEQRKLVIQQNYPNPVMTVLMQQLMGAQQQVAKLEVDYSPTNNEAVKATAELNTINSQIDDQIKAVVRGLENKINTDKNDLETLKEQAKPMPTPAPVNDEEDQEIQRIQKLIQNSPDLINAASSGQTELASAAAMGRLKVAAYLLEHGADVNNVGKENPPLYAAAEAGNRAMVEFLLNHGADVDIRGGADETALHIAAKNKFPAVAEVLLAHKADVNAENQTGFTPLGVAATYGDLKIVQMLLAAGANPKVRGKGGETALTGAITGDYAEIVPALLNAGTDVDVQDDKGRTPLSFAAEMSDPKLVKLLLDAKADPNLGKIDAPLLVAVLKKDVPTAQLLLEHGADPNKEGPTAGLTRVNLANVPNDLWTYYDGSSAVQPLFLAVQTKNLPMVQLLLKYKADANARLNGESRLFNALSDTNILEVLLAAGAKVDPISQDNQHLTPLDMAVYHSQAATAAVLLKHGANPNEFHSGGSTPLQLAALALADSKVFELLLANGADPNRRGSGGETALDVLKEKRDPYRQEPESVLQKQLADLLRRHGARDKLPNWDCIVVSRPAIGFTTPLFYTSTNDWNHFTLLEAILAFYESGRQYGVPEDNNSIRISDADDALPFPDLAHIVIVRPNHTLTNDTRIKINVLNGTNGFDLAKDVPLEFGDVVEIPELDHPLGARNTGLTTSPAGIIDRLKGTAHLSAGGQAVEIKLDPRPMRSTLRAMLDSNDARGILLSSSDLSRVKVTRHDPKTGRKQEWTVDTTASSRDLYRSAPFQYNFIPNNNIYRSPGDGSLSPNELDLWLRDGDVIEVPEKQ
jgi:ankyrin repeat protein